VETRCSESTTKLLLPFERWSLFGAVVIAGRRTELDAALGPLFGLRRSRPPTRPCRRASSPAGLLISAAFSSIAKRSSFRTMSTTPHVIVIGAGLGGLCLAQGLKKAGKSVSVYERDVSKSFRPQGYRIRIDPDGSTALQKNLSEDLWRLFQATCANIKIGLTTIDAIDAKLTTQSGPDPRRRPGPQLPAGAADASCVLLSFNHGVELTVRL
jgi:hypothetical protein